MTILTFNEFEKETGGNIALFYFLRKHIKDVSLGSVEVEKIIKISVKDYLKTV